MSHRASASNMHSVLCPHPDRQKRSELNTDQQTTSQLNNIWVWLKNGAPVAIHSQMVIFDGKLKFG